MLIIHAVGCYVARAAALYLERELPCQFDAMRSSERSFGLLPSAVNMGGFNGVVVSLNQSVDLHNASHMDLHDGSVGAVIWTESEVGVSKDLYFVVPNV